MLSGKAIDKTLQVIGVTGVIASSITLGHLSAIRARRTERDLLDRNEKRRNTLSYMKFALTDVFKNTLNLFKPGS